MYEMGEMEIHAVTKVLQSGKLFRYQGKNKKSQCDLFEEEFSKYIGSKYSLLLSSGTNALLLALVSAGVGPGDEVIIPTFTFVATANAVVSAGAIPILANIDEQLSLDVEDVKNKVSTKTRAIIPVHMNGLVANMGPLMALADKYDLVVIEDACQAIGGSYNGKRLGTIGDFGCYSLNADKIITCGEGGILTCNSKKRFEVALCAHDTPCLFGETNKESLQKTSPFMGFSMRISDISGAIMRPQLQRLDSILKKLRERKKILKNIIHDSFVNIPNGYCEEGDCGTSIHLISEDPPQSLLLGEKLREKNILFFSIPTRPAQVFWQWIHLLENKKNTRGLLNPYDLTDQKYHYPTSNYIQSIDILSKTLQFNIDINLSIDKTKKLGEEILQVIKDVHS